MYKFMTVVAGAAFAALGSLANAAPIDTSAYDNAISLVDDTNGYVLFDGPSDFMSAEDSLGDLLVDSFIVSDPLDAVLSYDNGVDAAFVVSASAASVMEKMIQLLFEDGATGYLVTIDIGTQNFDFTDSNSDFDTSATVRLEKLTTVSTIPLPASLPLILAGFGGLVAVRRFRMAR